MAISKEEAIKALLAGDGDPKEEEPKSEDPMPTDTDTNEGDDLSDVDLAAKLREVLAADSNAEVLSKVTAMAEGAASSEDKQCEEVVDQAIRAGKVTPAQRATALQIARMDRGAFASFVAAAKPVVRVARVAPAAPAASSDVQLTAEELDAAKKWRRNPEDLLKIKAAIAAKKGR